MRMMVHIIINNNDLYCCLFALHLVASVASTPDFTFCLFALHFVYPIRHPSKSDRCLIG